MGRQRTHSSECSHNDGESSKTKGGSGGGNSGDNEPHSSPPSWSEPYDYPTSNICRICHLYLSSAYHHCSSITQRISSPPSWSESYDHPTSYICRFCHLYLSSAYHHCGFITQRIGRMNQQGHLINALVNAHFSGYHRQILLTSGESGSSVSTEVGIMRCYCCRSPVGFQILNTSHAMIDIVPNRYILACQYEDGNYQVGYNLQDHHLFHN